MKKKIIISIVDSLEKINDSIIKNIDAGVQVSMETLVDCQDSAIAVGNEIEQQYGSAGEETVHLLEAYCENLYQMSSKPEDIASCRKLGKKIQKQLVQIRNHVKYDFPEDKKEIVFLPYKASMWDSLESVWRAADADPDCEAYVIPIPYFDKNPDGSFKEEHYEGNQYPKDVPITRYDEYDLETRRPDVIYIHNPYDECNHVTSVHPYFYSKNIRNYTDKLVYIPYFILKEIEPDNQAAIDSMKHFCFIPGTIYADQVIVQSENMRQIYINEYMKAAKEMGLGGEHTDRKFLEQKFKGTGSPKIDKVLHTKKEDLEIPGEWLKIIEKPDGSWKKIIFYNTSVSALLKHGEKMLKKMESSFGIFKENKDEIALLWRPHPLIQATIESMRPQLWVEYQQIKDKYIEEGWGIYDDTPNVDRAVVVSDAYYGDPSSVVQVAENAGRAALIQNVDKIGDTKFDNVCMVSRAGEFDAENGVLWMVTTYTSTLLKIELATGRVMQYYQIPVCQIRNYDFMTVKKAADVLYLIPYNADSLFCFSIETEKFTEIGLPLSKQEKGRAGKFRKAIYLDDVLYLIGYAFKFIIKMNVQSLDMERIEGFAQDSSLFAVDAVLIDRDIYIPCCQKNVLIHFNTIDDSWEEIFIEKESKGFYTIAEMGKGLLLTDLEDKKIFYNVNDKRTMVHKLCLMSQFRKQELNNYQQYQKAFYFNGKEYFFPAYESTIWVTYQHETKELVYEYPEDHSMGTRCYSKFEMIERYGDTVFFQTKTDGSIFAIDLNKDTVQKYALQMSVEQKQNLISVAVKCKYQYVAYETDIYDLRSFILYLGRKEK